MSESYQDKDGASRGNPSGTKHVVMTPERMQAVLELYRESLTARWAPIGDALAYAAERGMLEEEQITAFCGWYDKGANDALDAFTSALDAVAMADIAMGGAA